MKLKLPRILNGKLVAVFGLILAAKSGLPALLEKRVDLFGVWLGLLWFVGALFTWKKKTWAAVLLAVLAVYDLVFDLLPSVRTLRSDVRGFSAQIGLSESTMLAVGIVVYSLGSVILLCVLYYGVCLATANQRN